MILVTFIISIPHFIGPILYTIDFDSMEQYQYHIIRDCMYHNF